MKKILFLFSIILLTLSSCDKAFVNGDLDGMWRLERVDVNGEELCPQRIYYSFQRHIVMFGEYYDEAAPHLYMANFSYDGNTMSMNTFKEYPGVNDVCDVAVLERFCIYDPAGVVFDVQMLNSNNLVMSAGDIVYYFRKW